MNSEKVHHLQGCDNLLKLLRVWFGRSGNFASYKMSHCFRVYIASFIIFENTGAMLQFVTAFSNTECNNYCQEKFEFLKNVQNFLSPHWFSNNKFLVCKFLFKVIPSGIIL